MFKTELMKDPAIRDVAPSSKYPDSVCSRTTPIRRADEGTRSRFATPDFLAIDPDFRSDLRGPRYGGPPTCLMSKRDRGIGPIPNGKR